MKNVPPNLEIIYLNDCVNKNIIDKYWELDEFFNRWQNDVNDIGHFFSIPKQEVSKYVKENSSLNIYCAICGKIIIQCKLRNDFNWYDYGKKNEICCESCKVPPTVIVKNTEVRYVVSNLDKGQKMNIAIETQQWLDLNDIELEVLIKVAESKSKHEIYSKVFLDENINSESSTYFWAILERLNDMNLIWIDRDENKKITNIHKHGNLYNTLLDKYPHLIIKRTKELPAQHYGFSLEKNGVKQTPKEPDFIGYIAVNFAINIEAGTILNIAGWVNKNDGLYIRIQ